MKFVMCIIILLTEKITAEIYCYLKIHLKKKTEQRMFRVEK